MEILVVLAILGSAAGLTMLAVPGKDRPRRAAEEAALLAQRLDIAAAHSLVAQRRAALAWDTASYGFTLWDGSDWAAHDVPPLDDRHLLAAGLTLSGDDARTAGRIEITPDLLPALSGAQSLHIGGGGPGRTVVFDGAAARIADGGGP